MSQAAVPKVSPKATETTPLLNHGQQSQMASRDVETSGGLHGCASKSTTTHRTTPGLFQILLLCYARLMEPIAFFSIFPYIAQMVQGNGDLPHSDVGFYSGLVESVFSIAQALFLMLWADLADRFGRKPVILASLVGMAVAQVLFGLSTTLWQMILFRCLAGIFSSTSPIIRTMIGESCPPGKEATAFSLYSTAGNIALFLGPAIGGMLVDPVGQYPTFSGMEFLAQHPYLLPSVVVSLMNVTAAISLAVLLREPERVMIPHDGNKDESNTADSHGFASAWHIITHPSVSYALLTYTYVVFVAIAFTTILPVALYTPVRLGGFGYSTSQTSMFMTLQGAGEIIWLLIVFPALQRRIGTIGIIRLCAIGFPCMFSGYILMNVLLRNDDAAAAALSVALELMLEVVGPGLWMSFTATQLSLNDASPSPHILGKVNSVAELFSSLIRSIVPAMFSAIYAVGVRQQLLLGYFGWILLIVLSTPLLGTWRF